MDRLGFFQLITFLTMAILLISVVASTDPQSQCLGLCEECAHSDEMNAPVPIGHCCKGSVCKLDTESINDWICVGKPPVGQSCAESCELCSDKMRCCTHDHMPLICSSDHICMEEH